MLQYVLLDASIMLTTINYLILLKVKVNMYLFSSYRDATYMSNARVSNVCNIASMTVYLYDVVYMHVYGLIAWSVT